MRKTLFASSLVLLLASAPAWSVPVEPFLAGKQPPPASCTVECDPDPLNPTAPPLSCTSIFGNCQGGGGQAWISCDNRNYLCPA